MNQGTDTRENLPIKEIKNTKQHIVPDKISEKK